MATEKTDVVIVGVGAARLIMLGHGLSPPVVRF